MTDLDLEVADSFERIFPAPTVIADWDDVANARKLIVQTAACGCRPGVWSPSPR